MIILQDFVFSLWELELNLTSEEQVDSSPTTQKSKICQLENFGVSSLCACSHSTVCSGALRANPRLPGPGSLCCRHPLQPDQHPGADPQGHEEEPYQPHPDRHRSGGCARDAGVRALRCAHVPTQVPGIQVSPWKSEVFQHPGQVEGRRVLLPLGTLHALPQ